jgi:molecular chaperone GrpE
MSTEPREDLDPTNATAADSTPATEENPGKASVNPEKSGAGSAEEGETAEVSLEEFEQLQAKAAKADENWERLLRLTADFENFKKRAARDRLDAIKYANEALLEKLIPVLDNFEMALASAPQTENADGFSKGVGMIYNQLKNVMTEAGLEEIDASNQPFDPAWHQAVSQKETDEVAEDSVVQQLRKGYKLRERLVRPATVIVAKPPAD